MSKIKSFSDLAAWRESHRLAVMIYRVTKEFPVEERFGLSNQIRRAVVSIPSNIAEGFSRRSVKEKIQFYTISRGSLIEVQSQLLIARDVGYLEENSFSKLANQTIQVSKLINGLIKNVPPLNS